MSLRIFDLSPAQYLVKTDEARFRILVAGRRFGKSFLALSECLEAACQKYGHGLPPNVAYIGPTRPQVKDVAWDEAKRLTRPFWRREPSETELRIFLKGGGSIRLYGAEKYDRLRGAGRDLVVIDEYADIDPRAWTEALMPSLADRQGRALFIGTPKGFNHMYKLFEAAAELLGWSRYQFTTIDGGRVPEDELALARANLDAKVYAQEYLGTFEDLTTGRVYYAFTNSNIRPTEFDPDLPLVLGCDFNVSPMSWALAQEHPDGSGGSLIHVLRELVVDDANTPKMLDHLDDVIDQIAPRWLAQVKVKVYGDASAAARTTSGAPSDWAIIRKHLGNSSRYDPEFHVTKANPLHRDRSAAVNRMLANVNDKGFVQRLFVDPSCRELIEDFRRVVWQTDSNGNPVGSISKEDPARTHISDALGYYVYNRFALRSARGFSSERVI